MSEIPYPGTFCCWKHDFQVLLMDLVGMIQSGNVAWSNGAVWVRMLRGNSSLREREVIADALDLLGSMVFVFAFVVLIVSYKL